MPPKATRGYFFEDFSTGMQLRHATPRTITEGDLALYIALTGDRRPLHCSAPLAREFGYQRETVPDLLVFHMVFGKTVGDISLNAVANLGYADVRFLQPVYPGDTVAAESTVLGRRETSAKTSGIVFVRTRGVNQRGEEVLTYNRWVMVNKRDASASVVSDPPELPKEISADSLRAPAALKFSSFEANRWAFGARSTWEDYTVGERIDHFDGMTIEEADHTSATRLYQNTARVHFDLHQMATSRFGKRLMYGGHVVSIAYSLAYNGLEAGLGILGWNGGSHVAPTFAGDTIYAWSEVLDRQQLNGRSDVGALRLRLVAVKNADPVKESIARRVKDGEGKEIYDPRVVLDLDYWLAVAKK